MNRYTTTFNTWNKIASVYQDTFMELDLYDDTYNIFCNHLSKKNAAILEIGCGPGNITKYLLSKNSRFNIKAIDAAPNMIALAKKNIPTAKFEVMDCRKLHTLPGKYDGIICGFCMPYLSKQDSAKLLKDSFSLLNNNGILYFSVIEGNYTKSGSETGNTGDSIFTYYYKANYFKKELKKRGVQLLELIQKKYPKNNSHTQVHLIFLARKL